MINFTFVGNAVTKLSFTDSTNDFPAMENQLLKPLKMKNTATNEYLSEDKFKMQNVSLLVTKLQLRITVDD